MDIVRKIHYINAPKTPVENNNYLSGRIGFWGIVKAVNSLNNTVTVISDTGFEYDNIPVFSSEWVTVDDNKNYIPSARNLPPKFSYVFVLTPTFTATGAFVLCSGYSRGDQNIRELWAKNESELEVKNNCYERKTQGGWNITEEYANGNFKAISNDGNITFTANTTEVSEKQQKKEINIAAWNNRIGITEDGLKVTDKNGNKIEATSDGLKVTDKNGNIYESKSGKYEVTVKGTGTKKATFVMDGNAEKVTINGHLEVTA